jgi:hypothetical protein
METSNLLPKAGTESKAREYIVNRWCFMNTALVFTVALGGGVGIGWAVRNGEAKATEDDNCAAYMASITLFPPGTNGAIRHSGPGGGHVAVSGATVDPHSCEAKLHAALVAAGKTAMTPAPSNGRRALGTTNKELFSAHPSAQIEKCSYTTDTHKIDGTQYTPEAPNYESDMVTWKPKEMKSTSKGYVMGTSPSKIDHGHRNGRIIYCGAKMQFWCGGAGWYYKGSTEPYLFECGPLPATSGFNRLQEGLDD